MKTYKSLLNEITLKSNKTDFNKIKITSSDVASQYIRQFYNDDINMYESSFILLLNRANITIGYAKISQGGVTGTIIDARIVCKYAVDTLSSGVIICHNHPSGDLRPSQADLEITRKLKDCLNMFDIKMLDHIIITETGYYSFADEGKVI